MPWNLYVITMGLIYPIVGVGLAIYENQPAYLILFFGSFVNNVIREWMEG